MNFKKEMCTGIEQLNKCLSTAGMGLTDKK
jgi:hypothetical protein